MPKNKKRDDGRVQGKVYLGSVDGKAQYKYVYAQNNRDLERKKQEVKTKLGKGLDLTAERDSFSYWSGKWAKSKQGEVCAARAATYKNRCKNLSALDRMDISKIRAIDIQEIIDELATEKNPQTGMPYSKYTLTEVKNVCSQIFKLAIDNRVIDYNPVSAVKIPKSVRKPDTRRALTEEEQRWIEEFPHRAQTAAMVMMYAGLRRGELMGLTWAKVDLKAKTIRVDQFVEIDKGKSYLKDYGKSDAAVRTVYIPDVLVDYLENVPGVHFGFVVHKKDGSMMTESAWNRLWDSYITDLNLQYGDWEHYLDKDGKPVNKPSKYDPDKDKRPMLIERFTPHWLRHTFITMMYLAGVDILTAKEQAGHADIETTMGIYTHLDEHYKKKNITKLNDFIKGKKTGKADAEEA
ncbi:MAG: site-specific integrase [Ruminococcus sp.]|nr:site-specific integrase [Ruminiclostridium sp.]MBP1537394.1 site-specific integrase [Ruminococcus sp.]